jgi:hypothetical protein
LIYFIWILGPHCHLLLCIDHIHEHENLLRYEIEQLINGRDKILWIENKTNLFLNRNKYC